MQKFKVNGQSVKKIEWKQADEKTDGGDGITSHANAVNKKNKKISISTSQTYSYTHQ